MLAPRMAECLAVHVYASCSVFHTLLSNPTEANTSYQYKKCLNSFIYPLLASVEKSPEMLLLLTKVINIYLIKKNNDNEPASLYVCLNYKATSRVSCIDRLAGYISLPIHFIHTKVSP